MGCVAFEDLIFMEVDTAGEYLQLRESVYPALMKAESEA